MTEPSVKAVSAGIESSGYSSQPVTAVLRGAHPVIRQEVVDEIAAWVEERSGTALANWIRREFGEES